VSEAYFTGVATRARVPPTVLVAAASVSSTPHDPPNTAVGGPAVGSAVGAGEAGLEETGDAVGAGVGAAQPAMPPRRAMDASKRAARLRLDDTVMHEH
jgi:hypothetical protein